MLALGREEKGGGRQQETSVDIHVSHAVLEPRERVGGIVPQHGPWAP